jgi:8-oxo-dGTP diphosphatase
VVVIEDYTRVRVSGALVRDGKILLIGDAGVFNGSGFHYDLPGGGADPGERLDEAVRRELREEAACEVTVGPILAVYQYLARNSRDANVRTPSLGVLFALTLTPDSPEPQAPAVFDHEEHAGVFWVPLADLPTAPLNPAIGAELRALLTEGAGRGATLFAEAGTV